MCQIERRKYRYKDIFCVFCPAIFIINVFLVFFLLAYPHPYVLHIMNIACNPVQEPFQTFKSFHFSLLIFFSLLNVNELMYLGHWSRKLYQPVYFCCDLSSVDVSVKHSIVVQVSVIITCFQFREFISSEENKVIATKNSST